MASVWESSTQKGAALLLLLAISDYANDDGLAWPAIDTLAKKIRMSTRYTQDLIHELERAGELVIEDQKGPHTTNRYRVTKGTRPASPLIPASPLLPGAQRDEAGLQKGTRPASPEPSVNHQEPSGAKVVHSPSAEVFRAAAKSWPSKAQLPAIESAVGVAPEKLELWGRVVSGYILKGWNPRNVSGMLEFFNRGEVPGANGHQASASKPGFRLPDGI